MELGKYRYGNMYLRNSNQQQHGVNLLAQPMALLPLHLHNTLLLVDRFVEHKWYAFIQCHFPIHAVFLLGASKAFIKTTTLKITLTLHNTTGT